MKVEIFLQKGQIVGRFWPKKGQFWIFDKKTKRSFFYIYKDNASWEKSDFGLIWPILDHFCHKKGQFWIFGQKVKSSLFSVYGARASWEKTDARISQKIRTDKHESLGLRDSSRPKNTDFGLFWPKMRKIDNFWPKRANFEFSAKKSNHHFLAFMEPRLHEKTDKRESIGLRDSSRPKSYISDFF